MDIDYKVVGRRIKLYRKKASLTQEELSKITLISVQHLSGVENGHPMSLAGFIKICEALKISLDDLFCELVQDKEIRNNDISNLITDFTGKEKLILLEIIELLKKSREY